MELKEILIVQGDTYNCEIEFENFDFSLGVEVEIFFTCKELNICKKLVFDEFYKTFILSLLPEETINFPKGVYNFDYKIKVSTAIKTIQYKSTMIILEKNNEVICGG